MPFERTLFRTFTNCMQGTKQSANNTELLSHKQANKQMIEVQSNTGRMLLVKCEIFLIGFVCSFLIYSSQTLLQFVNKNTYVSTSALVHQLTAFLDNSVHKKCNYKKSLFLLINKKRSVKIIAVKPDTCV